MRANLIQAVRQQYGFRCGYCGISEIEAGTTLTIDHYQPRSQGGSDAFENLVYACHACNEHKGACWNPSSDKRILHPVRDDLSLHYIQAGDFVLMALSPTGSFHIAQLDLNRPALVANRRERQARQNKGREHTEIVDVLRDILKEISEINERIGHIHSGGE